MIQFKPDLVALADELAAAPLDQSHSTWPTILLRVSETKRAAIVQALRHLASQSSSYEAGLDGDALLDFLRDETCDLRCISVPTGGDDYDVRWQVIEHHMTEPRERVIGQSYTEEPRDAIRDAMARNTDRNTPIAALPADGGEVEQEPETISVPYNPCLAKLRDGEPFFVLLGRDKQAPNAVMTWANDREAAEGKSAWTDQARQVAYQMAAYSGLKPGPSEATPSTAGSVREALDLLQLQQIGRARALRQLDQARDTSDPITLAQADSYEECGNELRAALSAPVEAPVAWWRWRFFTQGRWSKWISLNDDEVSAFRDLQSHNLERGQCELQPLYATPRPLPSVDDLARVQPAIDNLTNHQEQCDQDGVMVKVSRQALDEVLTLLGGSAHGR